ncbi:hypothetical protein AB1Y20_021850 [Prymnesium parvum]|uniref:Rhodanese domain-containing protein n=1 Tax=Prymnesium parvum TaxID=97485 RepID=A0AB34JML2_PRYPA
MLCASSLAVRLPRAVSLELPRTRLIAERVGSVRCAASMPDHIAVMRGQLEAREAQLLDVREPDETSLGKLQLSELVPLSQLKDNTPPDAALPRDKLTYVHCKAGGRAKMAAPILKAMGFENVVPLAEGYDALRELLD